MDYRIILPYQEKGHEDRPWFLARVDCLDGSDVIGYLKMCWIDYDWCIKNYNLVKKVNPGYDHRKIWNWLAERANWVFVDYARTSHAYRRKGVATRMYVIGAAWLATNRSTCLHSSSIQSDEVKALWEHLLTLDLPIYEKSTEKHLYHYIDYSKTPVLRLQAKRILEKIPQQSEPIKIAFKDTDPFRLKFGAA